jgi:hypothetical protein
MPNEFRKYWNHKYKGVLLIHLVKLANLLGEILSFAIWLICLCQENIVKYVFENNKKKQCFEFDLHTHYFHLKGWKIILNFKLLYCRLFPRQRHLSYIDLVQFEEDNSIVYKYSLIVNKYLQSSKKNNPSTDKANQDCSEFYNIYNPLPPCQKLQPIKGLRGIFSV